MVLSVAFILDALKPARYWIEKTVVSSSVPSVVGNANRKKLSDFPKSDIAKAEEKEKDVLCFDHSIWAALLKEYIVKTNGTIGTVQGIHLVDYQGLAKEPKFDDYLSQLAHCQSPKLLSMPEQLAFWINAYNALCISLIVQDMKKKASTISANDGRKVVYKPVASINELSIMVESDGNKKVAVWDLPAGIVSGQSVSLNHIEHVELRQAWNEPAIHACIVCASASCPNLRQEPYCGKQIRQQMNHQMQSWMQNPTKGLALLVKDTTTTNNNNYNFITGWFNSPPQLELSRIFLWFEEDFGGWRGLQEWLPQYITKDEVKNVVKSGKASLRYFEYNWELNGAVATTSTNE